MLRSILGTSRENRRAAREVGAREQKAVVKKRGEWHRHVLLEFVSLMIFFSFLAAQSNNINMEDIIQQHVSNFDFINQIYIYINKQEDEIFQPFRRSKRIFFRRLTSVTLINTLIFLIVLTFYFLRLHPDYRAVSLHPHSKILRIHHLPWIHHLVLV